MMRKIMIPMAILFLLVVCVSSSATVFAEGTDGENVALGKPVTSSGYYASAPQDESDYLVNDGDLDTKWCARMEDFADEENEFEDVGHWIIIDLEQEILVSKFEVYQASTGGLDLENYNYNMFHLKVEVSVDGQTWAPLVEEDDLYDDEGELEIYIKEFDPISIRYFKLSSLEPTLTGEYTIRLPEIMIYAAPADATANPLPTQTPTPERTPTPVKTATPKPTATKAPVTATTAAASATPAASDAPQVGLPFWAIFVIVASVAILGGGTLAFIMSKKKK